MNSILTPLIERLKRAGSTNWESIASEAGVAKTLPRKIATGDRKNPGVQTIQPLLDYFAAVDRGERTLPYVERSQ